MQFNVISAVYFENYTATAANSSHSHKISCGMVTVRKDFEVAQRDITIKTNMLVRL